MLRTSDVYGHAFIRARPGELNVSWDRVDDQSQIDHSVAMSSPTVDAERSRSRPRVEQLVAERAGDRDAGLQDPFPDGEAPRPAAEVVLATQQVNRCFDQDPPQPRRPGFGDAAAPLPPATAFDARDQPRVTRQVRPIRKARDDANFGAQGHA